MQSFYLRLNLIFYTFFFKWKLKFFYFKKINFKQKISKKNYYNFIQEYNHLLFKIYLIFCKNIEKVKNNIIIILFNTD